MRHWLFGVLVVAACGGGTTNSTFSEPPRPDGGEGAASSKPLSCATQVISGTRACVPGRVSANTVVDLQVVDDESCLDCNSGLDRCEVTVEGNKIRLALVAKVCVFAPGSHPCPFICDSPKLLCSVPGLSAGTYTVEVAGEGARVAQRELVVGDGGGNIRTCSLPDRDQAPPPLDGAYDATCESDQDCHAANFGNVCQPCLCPNGAVTTTALEDYRADFRARTSQCKNNGIVNCEPCVATKSVCEKQQGQLKGTCVLRNEP